MSTALAVAERPSTALIRPVLEAAQVVALHDEVMRQVAAMLKDGTDYGIVPGTKKPSLYKAGAERLCTGFGLVDRYEIIDKEIDHSFRNEWEKRDRKGAVYASGLAIGLYRYTVKCTLERREDSVVVAEGIGECSSLESKYMDRPRDVANTILKMAKKRAKVDATLSGLGLSDRFTQDVEDSGAHAVEDEDGRPAERPGREQEVQPAAATPKAARERAFPLKGPFKGKPIGEMPLDAIEGYVAWITEKQEEKGDESFFADLLVALQDVALQKIAERDRDQTKLDLDKDASTAAPERAPSKQVDMPASGKVEDAIAADPTSLHALHKRLDALLENAELPKVVRDTLRKSKLTAKSAADVEDLIKIAEQKLKEHGRGEHNTINSPNIERDEIPF